MTPNELEQWRKAVDVHMESLQTIIDDRKTLKNSMEAHLKTVFDWDDIEYNKDFTVITLKWKRDTHPIVDKDRICQLNMHFLIRADYDDNAFKIVVIDVYPFGIPQGEN